MRACSPPVPEVKIGVSTMEINALSQFVPPCPPLLAFPTFIRKNKRGNYYYPYYPSLLYPLTLFLLLTFRDKGGNRGYRWTGTA
jgi:hypothetical protein